MPTTDRRQFIAGTGMAVGSYPFLMSPALFASEPQPSTPIIHVMFRGGWDTTYLFDARPLEMTAANLLQNYLNEDPSEWVGSNGNKTLATRITTPLRSFKEDITIINGIHMSESFDGHEQNASVTLTGDPFGGDCYFPYLNKSLPLDFVQLGDLLGINIENNGRAMAISPEDLDSLVAKVKLAAQRDSARLENYLLARIQANSAPSLPPGRFRHGNALYKQAFQSSDELTQAFARYQTLGKSQSPKPVEQRMHMVKECFRVGVTRAAVMEYNFTITQAVNLDMHAVSAAQAAASAHAEVVRIISETLSYAKENSLDGKDSLLDQATFLFSSEFSRTMRQEDKPIDATGTDHNPHCNTAIVAGKGIKGGQVIGESDFRRPAEVLSGAHLQLDARELKIFGAPFSVEKAKPVAEKPKVYRYDNYLTYPSVMNGLIEALGGSSYWKNETNDAKPAPPLKLS